MLTLKIADSMPCSHVSELGALFLMLMHEDCRSKGMALKEEDFYFHKLFFRCMSEAVTDLSMLDRIYKALPDGPERNNAGADWIDVLTMCDVPFHFRHHLETLIDTSTRRQLHILAAKLQDEAINRLPEFSSRQLIDSAEERLRNLRRDMGDATEVAIQDLFVSYGTIWKQPSRGGRNHHGAYPSDSAVSTARTADRLAPNSWSSRPDRVWGKPRLGCKRPWPPRARTHRVTFSRWR
jgi:hypothetical protein